MWKKIKGAKIWGMSIAIHVLLLSLLSLTGIFAMANHQPEDVTEVALYDISGGDESESSSEAGGSEEAGAPEADTAVDAVEVPDVKVPETTPLEEKPSQTDKTQPQTPTAPAEQTSKADGNNAAAPSEAAGSGASDNAKSGSGSGAGTEGNADTGSGSAGGTANPDAMRPEVPPQLTYRAMPEYPENLRQQNVTGSVGVSFVVGVDGSVTSASVDSSSGYPEMDAAALAAVYQYTFAPALNSSGQPVPCGNHTNIHFALR